jgi:hypothetical protein
MEQLGDAIKTAHHAVMEADLPPELQEVAFAQVLRHVLREASTPSGARPEQPVGLVPFVEGAGLSRLAARVGVSESALADLFEITEDSVSLHVASSRISSTKSRATREVALLITGARQGSGADEAWTAVEHVRETLQHYRRYDTNNFSSYLKGVTDAFNFRGRGSSMEVRLTQPGWEMAINLITSLAGGSS